jgi:hypothetical protein
MRTLLVALLAFGCISKGTDIPPVQAGSGVVVDAKTQTVSIDPARVPMLPTCDPGQTVVRGAAGDWSCAAPATNSDTVDGVHAAGFLAAGAQAADAAKLGGLAPNRFATAAAGDGVADDAKALDGRSAAAYLFYDGNTDSYAAAGDVDVGTHRVLVRSGATCLPFLTYCPGPYSTGATYCGATDATDGSFTWSFTVPLPTPHQVFVSGYMAGKALCERVTTCGAAAHVCSSEELARSAQLGMLSAAPPQAWFGGGASDCYGWTQGVTINGAVWMNNPPGSIPAAYGPSSAICSASLPIACCM